MSFTFFLYKKGINEYELERHFGDARVGVVSLPTQNRSRVNELRHLITGEMTGEMTENHC